MEGGRGIGLIDGRVEGFVGFEGGGGCLDWVVEGWIGWDVVRGGEGRRLGLTIGGGLGLDVRLMKSSWGGLLTRGGVNDRGAAEEVLKLSIGSAPSVRPGNPLNGALSDSLGIGAAGAETSSSEIAPSKSRNTRDVEDLSFALPCSLTAISACGILTLIRLATSHPSSVNR